jgi:hypothetical protein
VAVEGERMFAMQHGPYIPWSLAEVIYEAYAALYGTEQDIERMHSRGGFSWREVEIIFSELARARPAKLASIASRHPMPHISTTRHMK